MKMVRKCPESTTKRLEKEMQIGTKYNVGANIMSHGHQTKINEKVAADGHLFFIVFFRFL